MKRFVIAALAASLPGAVAAEETSTLANPAAVFCEQAGGEHVIVTEADGQRGDCMLPDGTRVDAWDYFRENWDKAASAN